MRRPLLVLWARTVEENHRLRADLHDAMAALGRMNRRRLDLERRNEVLRAQLAAGLREENL